MNRQRSGQNRSGQNRSGQNRLGQNRSARASRIANFLNRREWIESIVVDARGVAKKLRQESSDKLASQTERLRQHIRHHARLDSSRLSQIAGLVIEAVRRNLHIELFDVQVRAGIIVGMGAIAEMQTGEGKTLAGVIPAYWHSLYGRGVHVATTNEYLASRDHHLLQSVFGSLGVSTGLIRQSDELTSIQSAYQCDITYGTGYAFGFDYLRDQLAIRAAGAARLGSMTLNRLRGAPIENRLRQRGLHCAIIDEADHVLIDDAISPLVLSGSHSGEASDAMIHRAAKRLANQLDSPADFRLDHVTKTVSLTKAGYHRVYATSDDCDDMSVNDNLIRPWHEYVILALRAKHLVHRDVHYVVSDDQVHLVDQSTGRIFSDRTWSDGLQQAVLAGESLPITAQTQALAKISRQRFYRLYSVLGGMTGTAAGCEPEFQTIYGLPTSVVPTRIKSQRDLFATRVCRDAKEKYTAIGDETQNIIHSGRAVLIGTSSIEQSHAIRDELATRGIAAQVLNGLQDQAEALIVGNAGQTGAVTVATNLAGRGTDIKLSRTVKENGGLHVIVAQHHPLARVDRQMIGRAARCGEPGSASLFVASDDEWINHHAPWLKQIIFKAAETRRPNLSYLDNQIARAQRRCSIASAQARYEMLKRDQQAISLMSRTGRTRVPVSQI